MKILSLNIWGGRMQEEFAAMVEKYATEIDIFCFQEVYKNASEAFRGTPFEPVAKLESYNVLARLLPEHELIFHPSFLGAYGVCFAVRKSLQMTEVGESFIYKYNGYMPEGDLGRHARNLQYVLVKAGGLVEPLAVVNVHALWNGMGKTDTEERLEQSRNIVGFLQTLSTSRVILVGDLNIDPATQSIQIIVQHGLRDLIKDFGITSTRTPLYEKPGKFADYCFVSPGVYVKDFQVLPDVVSDHAPLLLEI